MLPRVSQVRCHDADYLLFSTSDFISNTLFRTGRWGQHLLEVSKLFVAGIDAALVLDIGANLGAYSIPLAKFLQPSGGKVIGFEPQRIVYYQLCGNVVLNRLDNYVALHCAVGDADGQVEIPEVDYENSINAAAFSLESRYRELHGIEHTMRKASTKVPLVTLDGFEVEKPPALIKIDVEGLELKVLQGATDFLRRSGYPPLLFEAWAFDWFEAEKQRLLSFVSSLGYAITPLGETDHVAQHPGHAVSLAFATDGHGVTQVRRLR